MIKQPLTNLQRELLMLYSTGMEDEDLNDLKKLLAKHYAQKSIKKADKLWNEKKLSDKEIGIF